MPKVDVIFYRDDDGSVPVLDWLAELKRQNAPAFAKCVAKIRRLADEGNELRRPEADFLRDGIYELRPKRGKVNYRILYFFHGRMVAVLASAMTKEKKVAEREIDRALVRKASFEASPDRHSYRQNTD